MVHVLKVVLLFVCSLLAASISTAETIRRHYDINTAIPFDLAIPLDRTSHPGSHTTKFMKPVENGFLAEPPHFGWSAENLLERTTAIQRTGYGFSMTSDAQPQLSNIPFSLPAEHLWLYNWLHAQSPVLLFLRVYLGGTTEIINYNHVNTPNYYTVIWRYVGAFDRRRTFDQIVSFPWHQKRQSEFRSRNLLQTPAPTTP